MAVRDVRNWLSETLSNSGRAARRQYLMLRLQLLAAWLGLYAIGYVLTSLPGYNADETYGWVVASTLAVTAIALAFVTVVGLICSNIKRARDLGHSARWLFWLFVPIASLFVAWDLWFGQSAATVPPRYDLVTAQQR